ncbi:MAG: hypothetical protein LLG04_13995 [Parachlamydia sp.]|nr:hypothetical protein [Parachlamydia sp.]
MQISESFKKLFHQSIELRATYSPSILAEKIKRSAGELFSKQPSQPKFLSSNEALENYAASLILQKNGPLPQIDLAQCSDAWYLIIDGILNPLENNQLTLVKNNLEELESMGSTSIEALELYPRLVKYFHQKAADQGNSALYAIAHPHLSRLTPAQYARHAKAYEKTIKVNINAPREAQLAAEASYKAKQNEDPDKRVFLIAAIVFATFAVLPFAVALIPEPPQPPCRPLPHDQAPPDISSAFSAILINKSRLNPKKPDEALCLLGIDPAAQSHPFRMQREIAHRGAAFSLLHPKFNNKDDASFYAKAFNIISQAYQTAERGNTLKAIEAAIFGR